MLAKNGHHKSGMKRKTTAGTEEASSKMILINRCGHTSNPRPPRQHFSSGSRHRFRTRDKTGRSSCTNSIARRKNLQAEAYFVFSFLETSTF
jgi:hypothetical protein